MSKATDLHLDDIVYCTDLENIPVKGRIQRLESLNGTVFVSIDPISSTEQRDPETKHKNLYYPASFCFKTFDELIDHEISVYHDKIKVWESMRGSRFKYE